MDKDVFKTWYIADPKHSLMDRLETVGVPFVEPTFSTKCDAILSSRYSGLPSHFIFTMLVFEGVTQESSGIVGYVEQHPAGGVQLGTEPDYL